MFEECFNILPPHHQTYLNFLHSNSAIFNAVYADFPLTHLPFFAHLPLRYQQYEKQAQQIVKKSQEEFTIFGETLHTCSKMKVNAKTGKIERQIFVINFLPQIFEEHQIQGLLDIQPYFVTLGQKMAADVQWLYKKLAHLKDDKLIQGLIKISKKSQANPKRQRIQLGIFRNDFIYDTVD